MVEFAGVQVVDAAGGGGEIEIELRKNLEGSFCLLYTSDAADE